MKQWKAELINKTVKECQACVMVKFYDVAREAGYNHIDRRDTEDILNAVLKQLPNHTLARGDLKKSLFTDAYIVERGVGLLASE